MLVNRLSEYNRSSLTKDPIGILRGACNRRPYELLTPLIQNSGSSAINSHHRVEFPLSEPIELGNGTKQPAENVEVTEITEKENKESQPTSTSKQLASER